MSTKYIIFFTCVAGAFIALLVSMSFIVDEPNAQSNSELKRLLKQMEVENEQYRKRVVEWSHYAWKLQHETE